MLPLKAVVHKYLEGFDCFLYRCYTDGVLRLGDNQRRSKCHLLLKHCCEILVLGPESSCLAFQFYPLLHSSSSFQAS